MNKMRSICLVIILIIFFVVLIGTLIDGWILHCRNKVAKPLIPPTLEDSFKPISTLKIVGNDVKVEDITPQTWILLLPSGEKVLVVAVKGHDAITCVLLPK